MMNDSEKGKNKQKENKNLFSIVTDKGETLDCEVVLTIDSDEFKKSYLVYTDHSMDDNGNYVTYASVYDPTGKDLKLYPIESDEEWDMIESVLSSAQRKIAKEAMENAKKDEKDEESN